MTWSFTPDRPIYLQLQEMLKLSIVSGLHPPGSKLPAVRDFALDAAVNPNTIQRALAELERDGLVYTQRTSGRFVTEDTAVIEKIKNELAHGLIDAFLDKMSAIGYGARETAAMIAGKAGEPGIGGSMNTESGDTGHAPCSADTIINGINQSDINGGSDGNGDS